MLVEKEVISPGTYWYKDQTTGEPKELVVTPELTRYWHDQGKAMLSSGLTIPVPCEHDFNAHPMTPAQKLKNNAGWVSGYHLKGDRLFSSVDVIDEDVAKKLPTTIKWTSPWISSFTDGNGKEWKNVISHLALTTRPRIIGQEPFGSVAAALSMADKVTDLDQAGSGFWLSRAGRINDSGLPVYPIAFSLLTTGLPFATDATGHEHDEGGKFAAKKSKGDWVVHPRTKRRGQVKHVYDDNENHKGKLVEVDYGSHVANHREHDITHSGDQNSLWASKPHEHSGAAMATDFPPKKKPDMQKPQMGGGADNDGDWDDDDDADDDGVSDDLDMDSGADDADGDQVPDVLEGENGDIGMEELLCDLLGALGIQLEHSGDPEKFKRELYNAAMTKIHELTSKGQDAQQNQPPNRTNPPGQPPNNPKPGSGQANPIIQQEQQPMFMSIDEINQMTDPATKTIALSMYRENQRLRKEIEAGSKTANSLRASKLREENARRANRVAMISRVSPNVKADLESMLAMPTMALSLGDDGEVVDPMAQTLAVLEKGLSNLPRMLTSDSTALSAQAHPRDDNEPMTDERSTEIADTLSRQMGCLPSRAAS